MADVESLELQITGDAQSAEKSIDSLIQTLGRLKTAAQGGSGLRAIANPLQKISTAVNSLGGSGQKLKDLAGGLTALSTASNFKISSNIANQITAINNAIKNSPTDYSSITNLTAAVEPLTKLGKGGLGTLISQIKKLPEAADALKNMDLTGFEKDIEGLAKKMKPLADEMQKVANGFAAFPAKIQQYINASNKIPSSNSRSALSFANLAAKVTALVYTLKKVGGVIASWINESNKYVENLNLFSVSMGEYGEAAMGYANTVSELMGIDTSDWIRNQGVFMTLATGFGVAGDRAAVMSQQLTQLGYDLSSFYNISVEEAMQKLKSGFAGELEPLRNLGYDLSQAKLEAMAFGEGIDGSVNSMTQAEKAQLRYLAIMTQVTQVQGDMARTLTDPANQLRIFKSQLQMAARSLGNIFIPALNLILPYAIAAVKVIRLLGDAIAGLVGFEFPEMKESPLSQVGDGASDSIDEATDSAKKLKKMLLGIDELNVMSDKNASGSSDGGDGFNFDLPTYDFIGEATSGRVNEIVEKMKEWLGITGEIKSWSDLFDTKLGSILKTATAIGVAIAAWKIGVGVFGFMQMFKGSGLATFFTTVATAISKVAAGTSTLGVAIKSVFAGAAGIIGGVATAIMGLVGYITSLISILREGESVTNILGAALGGLATAAGGFLIAIGVGATVATGGIVAAVIAAVAGVGMLVAVIVNHWEEIKAAIGTAWTWLYDNVLAPIGEWFAGVATWFYSNVITPIVNFFAPIVTLVVDMVVLIYTRIKEIVSGIVTAIGSVLAKVGEVFLKIVEIAVALGKAFYTYVITPIVDFIVSIATWVYDKAIAPIVKFFVGAGTWLYDTIINPIWKGIVWLKDEAVKLFRLIGTTVVNFISGLFKSAINSVLKMIENNINTFIRLLNGAITIINKIPGVNITKVTELKIPRLAEGGMVNEGQMFVAREAGPELVGSIGNRSAVVNNDQIVSSVSKGVYQAVVQAMGQSGNQTVEAKVNDKVLFEVVVSRARQETMRRGYNPLFGGA